MDALLAICGTRITARSLAQVEAFARFQFPPGVLCRKGFRKRLRSTQRGPSATALASRDQS